MTPFGSARSLITIGAILVIACLLFAVLTMCQGSKTQHAKLQTENATGKALDRVTTKTETINTDTKAKQDEADKIEGADTKLPDGYGSALQRVRDGKRQNP